MIELFLFIKTFDNCHGGKIEIVVVHMYIFNIVHDFVMYCISNNKLEFF